MPVPSPEDVVGALDATGFIFEQRVAQLFRSRGVFDEVEVNHPYQDPESGKTREIDVRASYSETAGDWRLSAPYVMAEVVAECKSTSSPFAVIGPLRESRGFGTSSYYCSSFDPLELGFPKIYSTHGQLNFAKLPGGFYEGDFTGTQLVRLNLNGGKWKGDNSGVFDSILYPLAKASKAARIGHRPEDEAGEPPSSPCFTFFYSILVTNGPVYRVRVAADSTDATQVPWARLVRRFEEEHLKGECVFEVVSFASLNDYIQHRIVGFLGAVERKLLENARYFDPEWLTNNLGTPEHNEIFEEWRRNVRPYAPQPDTSGS